MAEERGFRFLTQAQIDYVWGRAAAVWPNNPYNRRKLAECYECLVSNTILDVVEHDGLTIGLAHADRP